MTDTRSKKRVSIAIHPDVVGDNGTASSDANPPAAAANAASSAPPATSPATRPAKHPRRAMTPRQESLPAFTPDNYSSDEDDRFFHSSRDEQSDLPGSGWSNGAIPPLSYQYALHPYTRSGRLSLYSHHRRWINFQSSWSRIGQSSTELDAVHSESSSGQSVLTGCLLEEAKTVRALVAQLCECFYRHGWATGTGGGVSIRVGGPKENRPYRVFVAPSGVQKEDMVGDDVFELDMDRNVVAPPKTPNLRQSACTPLWYVVYRHVPTAMCVIHTHSMHAQMATLLDPAEKATTLKITHLEMLKGVGNHSYDSVLEIPIIDNRPTEDLLASQLEKVILKYPKCNAVLVRRHGVYVWGDSWEQAKAQCESFDYLFESAVKMKSMGLDCGLVPVSGTYREGDDEAMEVEEKKEDVAATTTTTTMAPAFNGAASSDNQIDLRLATPTTIPLLPRDAKHLLLDIEGTTTSIAFVKDTLFPYVLTHLDDHVHDQMTNDEIIEAMVGLIKDVQSLNHDHPTKKELLNGTNDSPASLVQLLLNPIDDDNTAAILADLRRQSETPTKMDQYKQNVLSLVRALMSHDVKGTTLKSLQGNMWKRGYHSGQLQGHVYSDFLPLLQWCRGPNLTTDSHTTQDAPADPPVRISIYSSGSIAAQKLLFRHTPHGDLTSHFHSHFDTTTGNKKVSSSYRAIAEALGCGAKPEEVVFVSDAEEEVRAAREAGMVAVVAVRPGNGRLSERCKREFPVVRSLLQLCGAD